MSHRRPSAAERVVQRRALTPDAGFQPLPAPRGEPPFRRPFDTTGDSVTFHCVGDTGGHINPRPQRRVVAAMVAEGADFLFHLGDAVYPHGESRHYARQFHSAYRDYRAPIFGVPGNHDAENDFWKGELALAPWLGQFCSDTPAGNGAAASRPRASQPHVHFTLEHPWLRIVGLWANVPEGGQFDAGQIAWLTDELRDTPGGVTLIIALHQTVLSADGTHGSNLELLDLFDACAREAGRGPDAVFSGHAHLYERFTAPIGGRPVPVVVAGAGGYPQLHPLAEGLDRLPARFAELPAVTLEHAEDQVHGFLTVAVGPGGGEARYTTVGRDGARVADRFALTPPGRP